MLLMVMMVAVRVIVKEATPESVVQSAKIHGAIYNARTFPNKVPDPSQTSHDQLEPRRQLTRSLCPPNIRRSGSNPPRTTLLHLGPACTPEARVVFLPSRLESEASSRYRFSLTNQNLCVCKLSHLRFFTVDTVHGKCHTSISGPPLQ